jgi:hypothetical protein
MRALQPFACNAVCLALLHLYSANTQVQGTCVLSCFPCFAACVTCRHSWHVDHRSWGSNPDFVVCVYHLAWSSTWFTKHAKPCPKL